MSELWDIYALARERKRKIIEEFLTEFLPDNTLDRREYEYNLSLANKSLYSGDDFSVFVTHGCNESRAEGGARIYVPQRPSIGGWIYFNSDGSLVLGLTVRSPKALKQLKRLVNVVGCGYGYIAGDAAPYDTKESFIQACVNASKDSAVRPKKRAV